MRVLVDTNVFIASLTDEPGRGEEATPVSFDNELIDNGAVSPDDVA